MFVKLLKYAGLVFGVLVLVSTFATPEIDLKQKAEIAQKTEVTPKKITLQMAKENIYRNDGGMLEKALLQRSISASPQESAFNWINVITMKMAIANSIAYQTDGRHCKDVHAEAEKRRKKAGWLYEDKKYSQLIKIYRDIETYLDSTPCV